MAQTNSQTNTRTKSARTNDARKERKVKLCESFANHPSHFMGQGYSFSEEKFYSITEDENFMFSKPQNF